MLKTLKSKSFYPVVFLTIIVLVSVSILLYINTFTSVVVEELRQARIRAALESIFPDLTEFREEVELFAIYEGQDIAGYAFIASGNGYSGVINILVGVTSDLTIKDIAILSQTETPGLGNKITEDIFTGQFAGLALEEVFLSREGGSVDAITGATVSSKAVTDAVRTRTAEVIEKLLDK